MTIQKQFWAGSMVLVFLLSLLPAQPPPDWNVNPQDFEQFMTITAVLEINAELSGDSSDVIAAFASGECRGTAEPIFTQDQLMYFLIVRADSNDEIINFLAWDASSDTALTIIDTLDFVSGAGIGTVEDPFHMRAVNETVSINSDLKHPKLFKLGQNYPNPFNPVTSIQYSIPHKSMVQIVIFDMLGKEITTLVSEIQEAGIRQVQWDATDMTSGMYFYQIKIQYPHNLGIGDYIQTKKMILLK